MRIIFETTVNGYCIRTPRDRGFDFFLAQIFGTIFMRQSVVLTTNINSFFLSLEKHSFCYISFSFVLETILIGIQLIGKPATTINVDTWIVLHATIRSRNNVINCMFVYNLIPVWHTQHTTTLIRVMFFFVCVCVWVLIECVIEWNDKHVTGMHQFQLIRNSIHYNTHGGCNSKQFSILLLCRTNWYEQRNDLFQFDWNVFLILCVVFALLT